MPQIDTSTLSKQESFDARKSTEMTSNAKDPKRPCYTACLPDSDNPNPEIRGYYLVGFGRSALFISFNFLVAAIIHFAYLDAGCRQYELDDDKLYDDGEASKYYERGWDEEKGSGGNPDQCQGRVYGVKPSSIVSVLAVIGGLVSAVGMPLAGSVVDATNKRHAFGLACASVLVVSNLAMVFLSRDTWLAMVLLQAIVATFSFFGLSVVVFSYLPELFETEEQCVEVTTFARLYEQSGMLVLLVLTIVIGLALDLGVVSLSVVAQTLAVVLGGPAVIFAFKLYKPRKANRKLREGRWLIVDGFLSLADVFGKLKNDYPEAAKFLVAQMFLESGTSTLTTAAILILDDNGMASAIGLYLATVLLCMMFGPLLHQKVALAYSIQSSLLIATFFFFCFFITFIFVAFDPTVTWIFAPIVGISYGWYYPALSGLFSTLVPGGMEGELAGLNLFTAVVLSWLPPLVITVFNERDMLRVGLLVLPLFWLIGGVLIYFIDPLKAASDIESSLALRQRYSTSKGPNEEAKDEEVVVSHVNSPTNLRTPNPADLGL
mmetsp:Transcript_74887/g.146528  ORF Transcript_74887/g.146528 Transcript_74887/m.146528 type:complete len:547 (+) Transcript_74887:119-1759(+)